MEYTGDGHGEGDGRWTGSRLTIWRARRSSTSGSRRWQEVPLWMFDRVACGMMRVEPRPQVDLAALSALASLVSGALGKAPPACAGWVSDDQDRGETHARSTQGSSQVSERIGATRPVRPGGQRQPGGHADVAHAAGSDTPEGVLGRSFRASRMPCSIPTKVGSFARQRRCPEQMLSHRQEWREALGGVRSRVSRSGPGTAPH